MTNSVDSAASEIAVRPYPRPGEVGGRLLRKIVSFLRKQSLDLPLATPTVLACSGGLDSTALLLLVAKYGRRIVAPGARLEVLHVNHGWRASASDGDEAFVQSLAHEFQLPIHVHRAQPPTQNDPSSWEDHARKIRQKAFDQWLEQNAGGKILTAHQADDRLETLLWRIFTGTTDTHGAGILPLHGALVRPLLDLRRSELQAFLEEEGRNWRKDQTNDDPSFLRVRVRQEILPRIEEVFPRAGEHLLSMADQAAQSARSASIAPDFEQSALALFWGGAGLSLRRPHVMNMLEVLRGAKTGSVTLPEGWVFRSEPSGGAERWILERGQASRGKGSANGNQ